MTTPTRLIHVTDPHLNFLGDPRWGAHPIAPLSSDPSDVIVVTGDITEAHRLREHWTAFRTAIPRRCFFVLGNHDFYRGHVSTVRKIARELDGYLEPMAPVRLDDATCLVGVDGWYDFRAGKGEATDISMADWKLIHDFRDLTWTAIVDASRAMAKHSAREAEKKLRCALHAGYRRVFLATHVPPFENAAWHEGAKSDPDWLAIMTNVTLGWELLSFAREHPEIDVTVLCGHTHERRVYEAMPNLRVRAGAARYGSVMAEVVP